MRCTSRGKMCWVLVFLFIYLFIYIFWCSDLSLTQGGAAVPGMNAGPALIRQTSEQSAASPFLCPPSPISPIPLCLSLLLQVMCWASSTPPQRKLSTLKALMSSSWDGVSWRPLIGWKLPNRTESQAGKLIQKEWARVSNRGPGAGSVWLSLI